MYYLLPRSREDLVRRMRAHKAIATATYGLWVARRITSRLSLRAWRCSPRAGH